MKCLWLHSSVINCSDPPKFGRFGKSAQQDLETTRVYVCVFTLLSLRQRIFLLLPGASTGGWTTPLLLSLPYSLPTLFNLPSILWAVHTAPPTSPPPPSSLTALLHQLCTVPALRGVREQKEALEERICSTEERRTGERDHGCSLCLAEDLGYSADLVPGFGSSGEWHRRAQNLIGAQGFRG